MSSIQSSLRQRVIGTRNIAASGNPNSALYVFIPTSANYVGNYPPGFMVAASVAGTFLPNPLPTGTILRDTGKTIKAVTSSTTTAPTDLTSYAGFFREVQLISPVTVASATASSTFGVGVGAAGAGAAPGSYPPGNAGDDGYGTFYIPIVVDGVVASQNSTTTTTAVSTYTGALIPDGQL